MSKAQAPTKSVIQTVIDRSDGMCEYCYMAQAVDQQHRRPRKMGGTRLPWVNQVANLLAVCRGCHRRMEANAIKATELGLHIDTDRTPADTVPYMDMRGDWWLLLNDGSKLDYEQEATA